MLSRTRRSWVLGVIGGAILLVEAIAAVVLQIVLDFPAPDYSIPALLLLLGIVVFIFAIRARKRASVHEDSKKKRFWQFNLGELAILVFLAAFVLAMALRMQPSLRGIAGLHIDGVSGGKYSCEVWYFYTPEEGFLFAFANDDPSVDTIIRPGSQALFNPNRLFYRPFKVEIGPYEYVVSVDDKLDFISIDGERFDLDAGRVFIVDLEDANAVVRQKSVMIDHLEFQREGGYYLLDAIGAVIAD